MNASSAIIDSPLRRIWTQLTGRPWGRHIVSGMFPYHRRFGPEGQRTYISRFPTQAALVFGSVMVATLFPCHAVAVDSIPEFFPIRPLSFDVSFNQRTFAPQTRVIAAQAGLTAFRYGNLEVRTVYQYYSQHTPTFTTDQNSLYLNPRWNNFIDILDFPTGNPINRMIAERFLAGTGAIVETAETGRVAVARHSAHPYDLILMDCHMPDMDGFEATAAIRVLGEGADVPIVAVTASAFAEDRERCRRAGMDGYIAKPLRREELIQAVAAALKHPVGKAG